MERKPLRLSTLALAGLLAGCGGGGGYGGGSGTPAPAPPPPAPAKLTLAPGNYQNASKLAIGLSSTAFQFSKLGMTLADVYFDLSLNLVPVIACPQSGNIRIELTDKNGDLRLGVGDTLHYRWEACKAMDTTTTGVVRVEVNEATQIPGGRDYKLTVTLADFRAVRDNSPLTAPENVNFVAQVQYRRDATTAQAILTNAVFSSGQVQGDPGTSTFSINYYQDHAAQTYQYTAAGNITSTMLGGTFDFTTPVTFTGVIGEYPSVGIMTLAGGANSTARLSEEGPAASDMASVRLAVDSNGDGVEDAMAAQASWVAIVPVQLFATFPDQVVAIVATP